MRKIKRNIMRKEYGNKNLAEHWSQYQVNSILELIKKYGTKKDEKQYLIEKAKKSKRDGASATHMSVIYRHLNHFSKES